MSPLFPAQRRADDFDAVLEGARPDDARRRAPPSCSSSSARCAPSPSPQARPEFVADLRARLMAEAETALRGPPGAADVVARLTVSPPAGPAANAGSAVVLGGHRHRRRDHLDRRGVPVRAARRALYPIKRVIEYAQTGSASARTPRARRCSPTPPAASTRSTRSARRHDPDDARVSHTLDTFTDQATEAGDLLIADYGQHGNEASIQELQQFTHASIDTLAASRRRSRPAAHDALVNAAQVSSPSTPRPTSSAPTAGAAERAAAAARGGRRAGALDDAAGTLTGGQLPGARLRAGRPTAA